MFDTLKKMLSPGESFQVSVSCQKDGALSVVTQPLLGDDPEKMPESVQQVRATLAMPLVLTLRSDTPDTEFEHTMVSYVQARAPVRAGLESVLDALKEADKGVKNALKRSTPVAAKPAVIPDAASAPVSSVPAPQPAHVAEAASDDIFGGAK